MSSAEKKSKDDDKPTYEVLPGGAADPAVMNLSLVETHQTPATKLAARYTSGTRVKSRKAPDLGSSEYYLSRELTWLNFNYRVLHEAEDPRTPLLERVKFIAIVCSNLDEFFMKRIGGLKQQMGAGLTKISLDGRRPIEHIADCHTVIRDLERRKQTLYERLITELAEDHIHVLDYETLTARERNKMRDFFYKNIFPLVTPQAIDPAHPFPFISNLSLNLLVSLRHSGHNENVMARVKVPLGPDVPRFLRISDQYRFVRVEDVISHNLDLLFPKMEILGVEMFRVTRNAITELDEDQADDLLAMIETELRYRKFAPVVRLQVPESMSEEQRGMLAAELGLDEQTDVFFSGRMMGKRDLMEIAGIDIGRLRDTPYTPIDHPRLRDQKKIFYKLRREGPILVYHPFESFNSSVERFLFEASTDPKVRAIKMTLYRTSEDSKVIRHLINAARNGKQVTVVVELKARFDEEANINWANHLEEEGIHVTYGVVGFKTHCKVTLVVRKDYNGLRRYAHFSTGNYHSGTARHYTDFGVFTSDADLGEDLTEFFNFLSTGFTPKRNYKKLLTAPSEMKKRLLQYIKREMEHVKAGKQGAIRIKTNAFQDPDLIEALYNASKAGVQIDLIVRDTCCLRPGIPGVSENIRVISIVSRFLEHARLYHFHNNGQDIYLIGSADCMIRNLESRVETLVPVEEPSLMADLDRIMSIQLQDRRSAWEMAADGSYQQRQPDGLDESLGSQEMCMEIATLRQHSANAYKRVKSKGKSKKDFWHHY